LTKIEEDFLPVRHDTRPDERRAVTKALVYHWIGPFPGQGPRDVKKWLEGGRRSSPHYLVGDDLILNIVPKWMVGWQGGATDASDYTRLARDQIGIPPWRYTVGIELCVMNEDGEFSPKTLVNGLWLGKMLCEEFKLNPKFCVIRHFDLTGKSCPKWFVDHPDEWEMFRTEIFDMVEHQREFDYLHYRRAYYG
jgi:hypothetical protein